MNINTIKKDFYKTQAFIKASELSTVGWDAKVINPESIIKPQSYGYVWDMESKFLWMFSAEIELFSQGAADAKKEVTADAMIHNHPVLAGLYQDAMCEIIRIASINSSEYGDWKLLLGSALINYAGTTRTWELAKRMRGGGHFVVCRYKNKTAGMYTLRPFYIGPSSEKPLDADDLLETLAEVYEADKTKHPEWFE